MAKKAFDGGRIFGVTHGAAPFRVLALPGWMHTAADWDATLRSLAEETGSVALDLHGFGGATPEPAEATGSAGYAELVAPVLGELDGPVVIVGHSFGGRVAVHLAATCPDDVAGLVLTGVPKLVAPDGPPGAKPAVAYRAARWLHRRGALSDERMEGLRRRSGSADYRNAPSVTMRNVLVAAANESYEEQLREIRCPVELVWGEGDTAAPVAGIRRAAELLGDRATLTVLPGVDHFTPVKASAALADAIRRLL
ncbi:MAG TPA: alpha/beta hydrolase [Acidimicrobiales bacterium]|nr:alpha/beta hydrolase [Acidimicrobiales bacterium]